MIYAYNQVIDLYSIAIAVILLFYSHKTADRRSPAYHIYFQMLVVTVILLFGDLLCSFDGKPGIAAMWANMVGNFILFSLNITSPSYYLIYVDLQIHRDTRRTKSLLKPVMLLHVLNMALVGISLFTGWLYAIDGQNRYHRGPLFPLPLLGFFLLTGWAFLLVITKRQYIERKAFAALALYPIPPIISIILQVSFYGMSLMLHGLILSQLIVFLSIQNRSLHTDYLTGAYNRKKLEAFLRDKVAEVSDGHTFSAIMIDLDNFKEINDRQGHDVGDRALEETTRLLKRCLRADDLVARYGGDEFYVVLDMPGQDALEGAIARIRTALDEINRLNQFSFRLSFSMGYAMFDPARHQTAEGFQKVLDQLMYQEKERKRLEKDRQG